MIPMAYAALSQLLLLAIVRFDETEKSDLSIVAAE